MLGSLHAWLGWAVVAANAAAGTWALTAHWRVVARGRALWVFIAATQLLIAVQVIIGVIDMQANGREVSGVHLFYGFLALFTIAIIYAYRPQLVRWQYLLYGLGGLFLMGLALRSMFIPALS